MNKRAKFLTMILFIIVCVTCCAVCFVACDPSGSNDGNGGEGGNGGDENAVYKYAGHEGKKDGYCYDIYTSYKLEMTYTADSTVNQVEVPEGQKLIIEYGGNRLKVSDKDGVVFIRERVLTSRGFDYYRYTKKSNDTWSCIKEECYADTMTAMTAFGTNWFNAQQSINHMFRMMEEQMSINSLAHGSTDKRFAHFDETKKAYIYDRNGAPHYLVNRQKMPYLVDRQLWIEYDIKTIDSHYGDYIDEAEIAFYNNVPTRAKFSCIFFGDNNSYSKDDIHVDVVIDGIGTTTVELPDEGHGSEVVTAPSEKSKVDETAWNVFQDAMTPTNYTLMKTTVTDGDIIEVLTKSTDTVIYNKTQNMTVPSLDENYTWKENGNKDNAFFATSQNEFRKQELITEQLTASKAMQEASTQYLQAGAEWMTKGHYFGSYSKYYYDAYNGVYIFCDSDNGDMIIKFDDKLISIILQKKGCNVTITDFGTTEATLPPSLQIA